MLKDRRILIEQEIVKAQAAAAKMYLDIVVNNGDPHSTEYQKLKDHIMSLQFDRNMVNALIEQGHA